MNTEEVANKLVELCRENAWMKAIDTLYDKDIVSVEARGMDAGKWRGFSLYNEWWLQNMEMHSVKVSGPFVAHDHFVVQYDIDVTNKASKERMQLSEVGIYTVKGGKVAREEFLPLAK